MRTGTALDRVWEAETPTKPITGRFPTPGRFRACVPQVDTRQFSALTDVYALDSDVQRSVLRHVELALGGGLTYVAKNQKAAEALAERLNMMAVLSGLGNVRQWFFEIFLDESIYGNAFLYRRKTRADVPLASAKPRTAIAYDVIAPETVTVQLGKDNRVEGFRSSGVDYSPKDIVHLPYLRPSGHLFGLSPLFALLDDVRMVRGIEDITYEMVKKNLHPILHARVGVDVPVRIADSELQVVDEAIQHMDPHSGYIVTRGHTELKMLGAESMALRTEGLIDRFRSRSYDALNLPADRIRNKDRIPPEMKDRVKTLREMVMGLLETTVFYEMLLDEGFDPIHKPEDRVTVLFEALDPDDQIKIENHLQQQYVQGSRGLNEIRKSMRLEPADDIEAGSRGDFLFDRERWPLATIGKDYSPGSTSASQDQPENQYGKKDSPGVGSSSAAELES